MVYYMGYNCFGFTLPFSVMCEIIVGFWTVLLGLEVQLDQSVQQYRQRPDP